MILELILQETSVCFIICSAVYHVFYNSCIYICSIYVVSTVQEGVVDWNMSKEIFSSQYLPTAITWYGLFFTLGVFFAQKIFVEQLWHFNAKHRLKWSRGYFNLLVDRIELYIMAGVLIGARLCHVLFYDDIDRYFSSCLLFFKVWQGGLAGHGAIIGVLLALYFFNKRYKTTISFVAFLDLLTIPALVTAGAIRLGNFVNQELLGVASSVPWAVKFLNPLNPFLPIVLRHPVQIYATIFYWTLAWLLTKYSTRKVGRVAGIAISVVYIFRIWLETLKEPVVLYNTSFKMGQILSTPFLLLGLFLLLLYRGAPTTSALFEKKRND